MHGANPRGPHTSLCPTQLTPIRIGALSAHPSVIIPRYQPVTHDTVGFGLPTHTRVEVPYLSRNIINAINSERMLVASTLPIQALYPQYRTMRGRIDIRVTGICGGWGVTGRIRYGVLNKIQSLDTRTPFSFILFQTNI